MGQGLPKWAIKKAQAAGAKNVFAYAWSLVKKTGEKKPKGLKTSSRKSKSSGSRKMAKKRRRRRGGMTIPIAPIVGLAVGIMPAVDYVMHGNWESAIEVLGARYTGYSMQQKNFNAMRLIDGIIPLVAGLLVHKFVGGAPLNLNRTLAKAGVPFIRI